MFTFRAFVAGYLTRSHDIFPRGLTVTKSFTSILCASAGEISIGDPKYYIIASDTLIVNREGKFHLYNVFPTTI